ncbi:Uncharacterised protein [Yokenella regensburgei]|nr:Uncharacterised protein [Yokenella regensburgei]
MNDTINIKSTPWRGFFISQSLNTSRNNAVKNEYMKEKLYRLNHFNGLYLEVEPNGKKAYRCRFKLNGKSSMFAKVKLAEAREKCEQVADGDCWINWLWKAMLKALRFWPRYHR